MPNEFKTEVIRQHASLPARITEVTTPHGTFTTPCFMPVGTRAYVNHMTVEDLQQAGSEIILGGNTYHMLLAPGTEVIQSAGGMHPFMNWHSPMLTDSGGFQVFSLSKNGNLCKIKEDGAHFKHPVTGETIHMDAACSINTQKIIGADIIMAFDQCTPESASKKEMVHIMERTHRWLLESKAVHDKNPNSAYGNLQALFAIIQGGGHQDLREQCTEHVLSIEPDGIAIGGEAIGFDMEKTREIIDWVRPLLPENKSRYTMGVGLDPQNLIDVIEHGIDMFDCVAPTRNARHGALYHGRFVDTDNWFKFEPIEDKPRIQIKKSKYAHEKGPILPDCDCHTCKNYSLSYLHFLFKTHASLFYQLACIHNVRVMHKACEMAKKKIQTSS